MTASRTNAKIIDSITPTHSADVSGRILSSKVIVNNLELVRWLKSINIEFRVGHLTLRMIGRSSAEMAFWQNVKPALA